MMTATELPIRGAPVFRSSDRCEARQNDGDVPTAEQIMAGKHRVRDSAEVARVDPDDASRDRWIALCHTFDPSVGYRRHLLLAAFESAREMEEFLAAESARLRSQKSTGEADGRDWLSGRMLERGRTYPKPQPRRRFRS